jgi:hypothetical protein
MRSLLLASVAASMMAGCASDTLDNVTYRRLVDQFDSYDQCVAQGEFTPCYETLTFCADGRANANLEFRQEGKYEVIENEAIAQLPRVERAAGQASVGARHARVFRLRAVAGSEPLLGVTAASRAHVVALG